MNGNQKRHSISAAGGTILRNKQQLFTTRQFTQIREVSKMIFFAPAWMLQWAPGGKKQQLNATAQRTWFTCYTCYTKMWHWFGWLFSFCFFSLEDVQNFPSPSFFLCNQVHQMKISICIAQVITLNNGCKSPPKTDGMDEACQKLTDVT